MQNEGDKHSILNAVYDWAISHFSYCWTFPKCSHSIWYYHQLITNHIVGLLREPPNTAIWFPTIIFPSYVSCTFFTCFMVILTSNFVGSTHCIQFICWKVCWAAFLQLEYKYHNYYFKETLYRCNPGRAAARQAGRLQQDKPKNLPFWG